MAHPSASIGDTSRPAGPPVLLLAERFHDETSVEVLIMMSKMSASEPELEPRSWWGKVWAELTKKFVAGFSPVYFASVMGTGISANLLYTFPYPAHWLQVCGLIMGLVALVMFVFLLLFFALALYSRPKLFSQIHRDPAMAPAMGCFVMGYTTLITFLHGVLERRGIIGIWVLWWMVVFGSFYTCIVTFYFSTMAKHRDSSNFTPHTSLSMQYLLPVVTMTVAASLGGLVSADMSDPNLQIVTMTVSLIMWAIAMLLASVILTVNFWRMFVHKVPNSDQVLSMFLPIGFVGQGAFAILLFGRNCSVLLMENHHVVSQSPYVSFLSKTAAENNVSLRGLALIIAAAIMVACSLVAFMLMAFGFLLTIFAYMAVLSKMAPFAVKKNTNLLFQTTSMLPLKRVFVGLLKFQRGFWSMTFPLGTMSLATHQFYKLYNGFVAFRVVATIYAILVLATTLGCLAGVLYRGGFILTNAFRTETKEETAV